MVFKLYHRSIRNCVFSVICLLIVVELSKLFSNLLNFWVVIVLLNLTILVVLISAEPHSCVNLHCSDLLPGQEPPYVRLNLNKQCHLLCGHPPVEVGSIIGSYIS
jgi:hypothetical protein